MTDLTDADRAEIERIIGPRENKSLRDVLRDSLEHGVAYGIAAGRAQMREDAAKACDTHTETVEYGMDSSAQELADTVANNCAAAIRALP